MLSIATEHAQLQAELLCEAEDDVEETRNWTAVAT